MNYGSTIQEESVKGRDSSSSCSGSEAQSKRVQFEPDNLKRNSSGDNNRKLGSGGLIAPISKPMSSSACPLRSLSGDHEMLSRRDRKRPALPESSNR